MGNTQKYIWKKSDMSQSTPQEFCTQPNFFLSPDEYLQRVKLFLWLPSLYYNHLGPPGDIWGPITFYKIPSENSTTQTLGKPVGLHPSVSVLCLPDHLNMRLVMYHPDWLVPSVLSPDAQWKSLCNTYNTIISCSVTSFLLDQLVHAYYSERVWVFCCFMTTLFLCLQINRSDIRPQVKWSVWWLKDGHLIFFRGLCGYAWIDILTLSPQWCTMKG